MKKQEAPVAIKRGQPQPMHPATTGVPPMTEIATAPQIVRKARTRVFIRGSGSSFFNLGAISLVVCELAHTRQA
jgi:hypothetical protein